MATFCDFVPVTTTGLLQKTNPSAKLLVELTAYNLAAAGGFGFVPSSSGDPTVFEFQISGDTKQFQKLVFAFDITDVAGAGLGHSLTHLDTKSVTYDNGASSVTKQTEEGWLSFVVDLSHGTTFRFRVNANSSTILHGLRVSVPLVLAPGPIHVGGR